MPAAMPAAPSAPLTAKLAELADLDELLAEADEPGAPAELEPLPSFDVPADRRVVDARSLAATVAAAKAGATHVSGAAGCASALVVRALARKTRRRIVAVTADTDAARALAADVSFLLGERDADDAEAAGSDAFGKVLLFLPNEASPYADVNPDRRGAEMRLATLFHLAVELPWTVLVCPIAALSRKVVPRDDMMEHAELVVAEQEIDRDALTTRLARMGYVRSPLVEDPGTFAVRGALLDVWAPSAEAPVRVELYGDLVMSLKAFDPESQRTLRDVREVWISPAREAILTPAAVERARERVRALCDAVELPSSKARALVDDVASGRSFFGSEGFLPAYVELSTLGAYLPEDAVFVLEDPAAITGALRDEQLGRRRRRRGGAEGPRAPLPPPRLLRARGPRGRAPPAGAPCSRSTAPASRARAPIPPRSSASR